MNQNTKLRLITEALQLLRYIIEDREIFTYRTIERLKIMAEKELDSDAIMASKTMKKFDI